MPTIASKKSTKKGSPKGGAARNAKKHSKKSTKSKTANAKSKSTRKLAVSRVPKRTGKSARKAEEESSEDSDLESIESNENLETESEVDANERLLPDADALKSLEETIFADLPQDTSEQLPQQVLNKLSSYLQHKVSPATLRTYEGNRNTVIKRGYKFTVCGVLEFMMSTKSEDLRVSNQTMECIISTLKHFHFIQNLDHLSPKAQQLLASTLRARKQQHRDSARVTGAMNAVRTLSFEKFLNKKVASGSLEKEDSVLFTQVAWTLYACALRVFQLRLLEVSSFYELEVLDNKSRRKVKELYVKVRPKGADRDDRLFERKQVHPAYADAIRKYVKVLSGNTNLFVAFNDAKKQQFSDLLQECARSYGWPSDTRFSGTHCFRHGAAQDAFVESNGDLYLVKLRTGHLSKKAAQLYALSDLERTIKAKKNSSDAKEDLNQKIVERIHQANQQIKKKFTSQGIFTSKNCLGKKSNEAEPDSGSNDDEGEDDEEDEILKNYTKSTTTRSQDTSGETDDENDEERLPPYGSLRSKKKKKDDLAWLSHQVVLLFPQKFKLPMKVLDEEGDWVEIPAETLNHNGIVHKPTAKNYTPVELQLLKDLAAAAKLETQRAAKVGSGN